MKKKILSIILTGILSLTLAACGKEAENQATEKEASETRTVYSVSESVKEETKTSKDTKTSNAYSYEEVKKNLEIESVPTLDGLMCVFITNNSNQIIDELNLQVNYKDESGNTIDTYKDGHDMILPGYTVVSRLDTPDTYNDFETVPSIELGAHPNYENHSEKVTVNSNKGEDGVIVEITNGAGVILDEVEYTVVFYMGDDIASIGYPNDIIDVAPGETVTGKCRPYGGEYDHFEVYLNQAHTFGM